MRQEDKATSPRQGLGKGHQGTVASGPDSHGSPPIQKHLVWLPSGSEAEVTAIEGENGNTCCLHCTPNLKKQNNNQSCPKYTGLPRSPGQ